MQLFAICVGVGTARDCCEIHEQNRRFRKIRVFGARIPHSASQSVQIHCKYLQQIYFATVSGMVELEQSSCGRQWNLVEIDCGVDV